MKRKIKFRGLRVDGKGWVYGVPFEIKEEGICFIIDNCQSSFLTQEDTSFQGKGVIPETVGQYTGFKDKNGAEIYEGDEVNYDNTAYDAYGKNINGIVVNYKGSWAIKYQSTFTKEVHFMYKLFSSEDFVGAKSKVIGNIHEKGGEK